jgi:putative DNA primase/helicase
MCAERLSNIGAPNQQELHPVLAEQIPHELVTYPQWVCWRYIARGEGRKPDKQPVNPRTLANAGVHWANTWTSFDEAFATYLRHGNQRLHGIGFVLTQDDPYVAVDLDSCVHDEELDQQAIETVDMLKSYTEISPSGQGLRILVACPAFHNNRRREAVEVYSHNRYVTITGHHVAGTPPTISSVPPELIATLMPSLPEQDLLTQTQAASVKQYAVGTMELWERIFAHDKYGHQHLQRFQGDTALDRGDHSFTVIRLLNCLARWTQGDAAKMRSMMLLSPLANEKWFEKRGGGDWLDYQIADAIAYVRGRKGK